MKHNYFEKLENKYVFNFTLIFWHLFIILASLGLIIGVLLLLWGIIPPLKQKAEKEAYPNKKPYPSAVTVALQELILEKPKPETKQKINEEIIPEPIEKQKIEPPVNKVEDTRGKAEFLLSMNVLKTQIPPQKYSWDSKGEWGFSDINSERLWKIYKLDKYRQWRVSEKGITDKLDDAFINSKAKNYTDKKQILDAFIAVIKPIKELSRPKALQILMEINSESPDQTTSLCLSVSKVVPKFAASTDLVYLQKLIDFGFQNTNQGKDFNPFFDYITSNIEKFNSLKRTIVLEQLINSYYYFFNWDFAKQKEATDLFIPMVSQIKMENYSEAIMQYYRLYLSKNQTREQTVVEIDNEYQQAINEIEVKFKTDQILQKMKYDDAKRKKIEWRMKGLMGIGGGIVLTVLIATILVFLSIQRSVTRIEEKIGQANNNN